MLLTPGSRDIFRLGALEIDRSVQVEIRTLMRKLRDADEIPSGDELIELEVKFKDLKQQLDSMRREQDGKLEKE